MTITDGTVLTRTINGRTWQCRVSTPTNKEWAEAGHLTLDIDQIKPFKCGDIVKDVAPEVAALLLDGWTEISPRTGRPQHENCEMPENGSAPDAPAPTRQEGSGLWKCACGWTGSPSDMKTNAADGRVCPSCGASGGLVKDHAPAPTAPSLTVEEVANALEYEDDPDYERDGLVYCVRAKTVTRRINAALAKREGTRKHGEGYPPDWVHLHLMVAPNGEQHAVGGDRAPGEGDMPYIGFERMQADYNRHRDADLAQLRADLAAKDARNGERIAAINGLRKERDAAYAALAVARKEREGLSARIKEIAMDRCADYPNVENTTDFDRLWAIHEGYKGTHEAIGDWEKALAAARKDAEQLDAANKQWFSENKALRERAEKAERERDGWHSVVKDCERIVNALGTAESALMSNLPNLVRDRVVALNATESENRKLTSVLTVRDAELRAAGDDRLSLLNEIRKKDAALAETNRLTSQLAEAKGEVERLTRQIGTFRVTCAMHGWDEDDSGQSCGQFIASQASQLAAAQAEVERLGVQLGAAANRGDLARKWHEATQQRDAALEQIATIRYLSSGEGSETSNAAALRSIHEIACAALAQPSEAEIASLARVGMAPPSHPHELFECRCERCGETFRGAREARVCGRCAPCAVCNTYTTEVVGDRPCCPKCRNDMCDRREDEGKPAKFRAGQVWRKDTEAMVVICVDDERDVHFSCFCDEDQPEAVSDKGNVWCLSADRFQGVLDAGGYTLAPESQRREGRG